MTTIIVDQFEHDEHKTLSAGECKTCQQGNKVLLDGECLKCFEATRPWLTLGEAP